MERSRIVLYTLLNSMVAAGALGMLLDWEPSILVSMLVFVMVPGFVLFRLYARWRNRGVERSRSWYYTVSKIWIACGWALCVLPSLFYGALLITAFDPWPLSRAQGPDTPAALAGFARVLQIEPDEGVRDVFYKGYLIRDTDEYLRFDCAPCDALESWVREQELEPVDDPGARSRNLGGEHLDWWLDADEAARLERWDGPLTHVWMDSTTGRAYVRTFTF